MRFKAEILLIFLNFLKFNCVFFKHDFNFDDLMYFFENVNESLVRLNISDNKLDAKIFHYLFVSII